MNKFLLNRQIFFVFFPHLHLILTLRKGFLKFFFKTKQKHCAVNFLMQHSIVQLIVTYFFFFFFQIILEDIQLLVIKFIIPFNFKPANYVYFNYAFCLVDLV